MARPGRVNESPIPLFVFLTPEGCEHCGGAKLATALEAQFSVSLNASRRPRQPQPGWPGPGRLLLRLRHRRLRLRLQLRRHGARNCCHPCRRRGRFRGSRHRRKVCHHHQAGDGYGQDRQRLQARCGRAKAGVQGGALGLSRRCRFRRLGDDGNPGLVCNGGHDRERCRAVILCRIAMGIGCRRLRADHGREESRGQNADNRQERTLLDESIAT